MKKILALCVIASMASGSRADIGINMETVTGYIVPFGVVDDSSLFSGSGLVQLIWSSSAGYSSQANSAGGALDAGFTLLFSTVATFNSGLNVGGDLDGSAVYLNSFYSQNLNAGFVYARIFDSADALSGYYTHTTQIGPGLVSMESAPPPTPDGLDLGVGPASIDLGGYYVNPFNIAVVPEPSVLAFLGLGGLALAARRRFIA